MRVVELQVSNFMGIKAVDIKPGEGVVVLAGDNGQGKTSILDAIECAVRGKKYAPEQPVRRGEKQAEINLDLGDLKICRRFKADGTSTISVTNADDMAPRKPQQLLDSLASAIAFDPLEMCRLSESDQISMLRDLAGIDLSEIEGKHAAAYQKRTDIGRDGKSAAALVAGLPNYPDAPGEAPDVSKLMETAEGIRKHNGDGDRLKQLLADSGESVAMASSTVGRIEANVTAIEASLLEERESLKAQKKHLDSVKEDSAELSAKVESFEYRDASEVDAQIANAGEVAQQVSANATHAEQSVKADALRSEYAELTSQIESLNTQRREMIENSKLPVDGLLYGEDGVTLNGIPFSQCSTAEKIKSSIALGVAANPKLGVMLMRDGSMLDDSSMSLVAEIAAESKHQLWIERVGKSDRGAIVIEDGEVLSDNQPLEGRAPGEE